MDKQKNVKKGTIPYAVAFLLGIFGFTISMLLPFTYGLTQDKVNDSSIVFEFAPEFFETTLRGYESNLALFEMLLFVLLILLYFITKKRWQKFLLIPLAALVFIAPIFWTLLHLMFHSGPFGDSLLVGFFIMMISLTSLIVITAIKPIEKVIPSNVPKSKIDLLDELT